MSELKAETIVPQGTTITLQMYPKADADKVIAEKDAKILALEAEVFKQKQHAELFLDERNYAETQLRHQKYKRCLAMSKWCYLRFVRYENYLQKLCASNATIASYKFRRDMYDKWEKRWLELAEEPTWAKFLQLIHKEAK